MELQDTYYPKEKYIETATGNRVSRDSVLCGSQHIVLSGKVIVLDGVIIRGDLANVRVGRQCVILRNAVVRPPFKKFSKGRVAFFPLTIGDCVVVGEGSILNSAAVGSYVDIGSDCVVGRRCVLKDCCRLLAGTVLPPETVVPPFAVMAGSPARQVGELPEATPDIMAGRTRELYARFVLVKHEERQDATARLLDL